MNHRPIGIDLTNENQLQVTWSDHRVFKLPVKTLREVCPCATCREQRSASEPPKETNELTVLSLAETRPLQLTGMSPVGNYAYQLAFSDGHDTGIFTIEFLRNLCEAIDSGESKE